MSQGTGSDLRGLLTTGASSPRLLAVNASGVALVQLAPRGGRGGGRGGEEERREKGGEREGRGGGRKGRKREEEKEGSRMDQRRESVRRKGRTDVRR